MQKQIYSSSEVQFPNRYVLLHRICNVELAFIVFGMYECFLEHEYGCKLKLQWSTTKRNRIVLSWMNHISEQESYFGLQISKESGPFWFVSYVWVSGFCFEGRFSILLWWDEPSSKMFSIDFSSFINQRTSKFKFTHWI